MSYDAEAEFKLRREFDDLFRDNVDEGFVEKGCKEPVKDSYGNFGFNQLVGHGEVTFPDKCGSYRGRYGCLNVKGHELPLMLRGEKWQGQVYQHPVFYSCHRPSCPRCFRSWMVREAKAVEFRLLEA